MGIFEIILLIIIAVMAVLLIKAKMPHKKKKVDRLGRRPPYIDLGLDNPVGFMEEAGQMNVEYLSRHWIAEQDVKCPRCEFIKVDTLLVEQGDYSTVKWTWVNNGVSRHKNECVFCDECQNWLLASPDTEHNDHTNNEEDPPEYFYFVRKSELEVVRDKYGDDALAVDNGGVYVTDDGDREATFDKPAVPSNSIDDKPLPTEPSPPIKDLRT